MIVVFLWARRSSSHWTSSSVLVCNMHHMIRIKIICWSNVVLFSFFFHSILISFSSLLRSRVSGSTSQQASCEFHEKQEKRGLGPGPGRVEDDDDSLPWSEQSGMHAAVHHQLMTTTAPMRRRMTMMIAYIIIINLYTYLYLLGPTEQKWKMQKQKPKTALGLVWLLVRLGSSFKNWFCVHFLSVLLPALSHPRPCDPKRPPPHPHPHPTVARFSCRSVVLPCSASCLWRRGGWGWLAAGWGVMALQFTATDSQQNRLWDWSWNAITINKCRKDTVKRSGEESEILINKSH